MTVGRLVKMQIQVCPSHRKYTGKNKPTSSCENCWSLWAMLHPALIGPTLSEMHAQINGQEVNEVPHRARRGFTV